MLCPKSALEISDVRDSLILIHFTKLIPERISGASQTLIFFGLSGLAHHCLRPYEKASYIFHQTLFSVKIKLQ